MKIQVKGVWKEKRKVKRYIHQSKEVQEQFGRKMNQDVNGNRNCSERRWVRRMEGS